MATTPATGIKTPTPQVGNVSTQVIGGFDTTKRPSGFIHPGMSNPLGRRLAGGDIGDKLRNQDFFNPPVEPDYGFKGVADAKDPLMAFLNKGGAESTDAMKDRYGSLFDSGNFGFRGGANLGMDDATTGALRGRQTQALSSILGNARGSLTRQVPFDFAKRQSIYQGLADANLRSKLGIEAQGAQAREAAKQKKSALFGGVLGAAGGIIGGIYGGPAGASAGAGVGGMAGSQMGGGM